MKGVPQKFHWIQRERKVIVFVFVFMQLFNHDTFSFMATWQGLKKGYYVCVCVVCVSLFNDSVVEIVKIS